MSCFYAEEILTVLKLLDSWMLAERTVRSTVRSFVLPFTSGTRGG